MDLGQGPYLRIRIPCSKLHQCGSHDQAHKRNSPRRLQKSEGPSIGDPYVHHSRILQYPIFKIPTIDRWIVVVSGKYTEELHRAPEDVLSFNEAVNAVGLSCLTSSTYLVTILVFETRIHIRRAHRKGSVALQDNSWISTEIQFTLRQALLTFPACSQSHKHLGQRARGDSACFRRRDGTQGERCVALSIFDDAY